MEKRTLKESQEVLKVVRTDTCSKLESCSTSGAPGEGAHGGVPVRAARALLGTPAPSSGPLAPLCAAPDP